MRLRSCVIIRIPKQPLRDVHGVSQRLFHYSMVLEEGERVPRAPKKPCHYPGCPRLTESYYCEEHAVKARRQYDKYERSPNTNKKYGRAWKRIRDRYSKEHPLCERCLLEGRITLMDEVHHVVPISRGGTHEKTNLMSLCRACHNKIHIELGDRR